MNVNWTWVAIAAVVIGAIVLIANGSMGWIIFTIVYWADGLDLTSEQYWWITLLFFIGGVFKGSRS